MTYCEKAHETLSVRRALREPLRALLLPVNLSRLALPRGWLPAPSEPKRFFQRTIRTALLAQLITRTDSDQTSLMDNPDAIGHFFGDAQLMRGDENRHPRARAFLQNVFYHAGMMRVETDHGLVDHKDFRVVQERGDNRNALAS